MGHGCRSGLSVWIGFVLLNAMDDRQTASDLEGTETPQEVSLDRLSEAFAAVLRPGSKKASGSSSPAASSAPAAEAPVADPPPGLESSDPAAGISPLGIFEAMLFVGGADNAPLSAVQAAALMRGVTVEEIHDLVDQLNARYRQFHCPFEVISEGTGYRLTLREELHRLRERFYGKVRHARLSQAAIDVLSLVAYHQPLNREEVDRLRGRPSGGVLNQLVRRQLLKIERPPDAPKDVRYHTTARFLGLLGLGSLQDLPRSQDMDRP